MKKRVLIPTLLIGTLLTGSLAFAACGGGGCGYSNGGCNGKGPGRGEMTYEQHEERVDRRIEMMSTVLDLSEAQQTQIAALLDQQWQHNQQRRDEMQAARDAMRNLRTADTFNEADFRARTAKYNELKTEMMVEKAKMQQELYAILTPEQQEKAEKLGTLMGGRGKGHHGRDGFFF